MKKLALTLAIILGFGMSSFAGLDGYNEQGGLFGKGGSIYDMGDRGDVDRDGPVMPGHGGTGNADGDEVPMGSGIVALIGFGAAYAFAKKREE